MSGIEIAAGVMLSDVMMGVGVATMAAGALSGGAAARQAGDYNAAVAGQRAETERERARIEVERHNRRTGLLASSQRQAYAASGVTTAGSPILIMADTAAEAEYDAQLIRYGGEVNAAALYADAAASRMQGRAAQTGSYFTAAGGLAKGAAMMGGRRPATSNKTLLGDTSFDQENA